jgi:hypothetical protein
MYDYDGVAIFAAAMVLLSVGLIGLLLGVGCASSDWRKDCEKHGMVISDGKVYECKVREEKK